MLLLRLISVQLPHPMTKPKIMAKKHDTNCLHSHTGVVIVNYKRREAGGYSVPSFVSIRNKAIPFTQSEDIGVNTLVLDCFRIDSSIFVKDEII